jgi:predicted cobalt transporter CbtA
MNSKHPALGAAVCALLLFAAPAASAQTAAQTSYSAPAGSVQQQVGGAHDPAPARAVAQQDQGASLPFTGFDLGLVAAAGGVFLVVGFAVRRITRAEIS